MYLVINKIIKNFVKFMATEKGKATNFFPPLFVVSGSGIRDLGSGINISDLQHCE
jgi:hypothetical protein